MAIQWEDKYSVGASEIDAQHKRLFFLVNEVEKIAQEKEGNLVGHYKDILKLIDELGDYSVTHFYSEELAMEECGCPDTEEHKKKHAVFVDEINNIRENCTTDKKFKTDEKALKELAERLFQFLKNWLTSHILVVDMKYKSKIKEL